MANKKQEEYQVTPIEVTGKLYNSSIMVLMGNGATKCFISPKLLSRFFKRTGYIANTWTIEYVQACKLIHFLLFYF